MAKIRVEGHLLEDRNVMVCSGETPEDASWVRDSDTGHVFVVLEHIPHEDVRGQPNANPRCFALRVWSATAPLPSIGRVLEVA
ncbi:MAG: hypothetical protein ABI488_05630 [Polyangiaceae bacterium]